MRERGSIEFTSLAIASLIVAGIAVLLRVPSCSESFWVDELHTAWAVHDGLMDVLPRAQIGHQQPYYFGLMWLWRQVFGESELALRMTSVLMVAISCVLLVIAVVRSSDSVLAGFASGLLFAAETNSIFFGTELRPYAAVMLASTASCYFASKLWDTCPSMRGGQWVLLFVSIGAAALMQLTSLGILAWLPVAVVLRWCIVDWRGVTRLRKIDAFVLLVIIAVVVMLMPRQIIETWGTRSIWASFGTAKSPDEIWRLWPWSVGLVIPIGVYVLNRLVSRQLGLSAGGSFAICLAAILVGSACLFWVFSYQGIAPLWHRRFMIAGLPMLAWCFGTFIGSGPRWSTAWCHHVFAASVTTALLAALMWNQGVLPKLASGRWQLVSRGEDWRGAIKFLNAHARENELVTIDPGLIEQATWRDQSDKHEYLSYPLRGPYELKDVRFVSVLGSNLTPIGHVPEPNDRSWILSRRRSDQLKQVLERQFAPELRNKSITKIEVRSFGGLSVATIDTIER